MSMPAAPALTLSEQRSALVGDGALALAACLLMLVFQAASGFPTLADAHGDNDSLLRLVQVRDLLAGQPWYDMTLYRMGLDGGFVMHWSRLVDLPIAMIIATVETVTGSQSAAETAALVSWPALLYGLSLFCIIRAARILGGEWAALPATIVGGLALYFVNAFPPGALDHHNVQLLLALAALLFLLQARTAPHAAALAGASAALMLAIAMEAAPYVAAACAVAAAAFLVNGEEDARTARHFGLAFAGVTTAALALTVRPGAWLSVECDALSLPQTAAAVLGGGGLALIACVPAICRSPRARFIALAGLGATIAVAALVAFPQCLADPYADVDPRLKRYWLDAVSEAQSALSMLRQGPATFASYYVTPVVALCALGWSIARGGATRNALIVAAFLLVAVVVSVWQVRGATFSIPLAAIALSAWIATARRKVETDRSAPAQIMMLATWLASINIVWQFAALPLQPATAGAAQNASPEARCYALADYDALAALPAGTVLAISNQGSAILHRTHHRVFNGPYHRNNAGNLAALDMLMGAPEEAGIAARRLGVDYVALCRGNPETAALLEWAPDGLLAHLARGDTPGWLTAMPKADGDSIEVWRVSPPTGGP